MIEVHRGNVTWRKVSSMIHGMHSYASYGFNELFVILDIRTSLLFDAQTLNLCSSLVKINTRWTVHYGNEVVED